MLSNERIKPSPCGFAVYTVLVSSLKSLFGGINTRGSSGE